MCNEITSRKKKGEEKQVIVIYENTYKWVFHKVNYKNVF
jgi:hypothetical protein